MFKGFITEWLVLKQIRTGAWEGTGGEAMSGEAKNLVLKIQEAQVSRSVCPYCGVGCGQLVFQQDGKLGAISKWPRRIARLPVPRRRVRSVMPWGAIHLTAKEETCSLRRRKA